MAMSNIRKKAQNKLRKKFGYSTNTNYGRGTVLYKAGEPYKSYAGKEYALVHDINIIMNNRLLDSNKHIEICTTEYADYGNATKTRYKRLSDHTIFISLEELDLIHDIAHQMAEENDWKGQAKKKS